MKPEVCPTNDQKRFSHVGVVRNVGYDWHVTINQAIGECQLDKIKIGEFHNKSIFASPE